jgi:hypothetical protein
VGGTIVVMINHVALLNFASAKPRAVSFALGHGSGPMRDLPDLPKAIVQNPRVTTQRSA